MLCEKFLLTNGARPWTCLHGHGQASEEPKGLYPFIDERSETVDVLARTWLSE
jgi:hypothetical protein